MNSAQKLQGRQDNSQKLEFYLQDDENTMLYKPGDMANNKFFGTWSRILNMTESLNHEAQSKYYNDYEAYYRSKLEIGSANVCFDQCVNNVN